MGYLKAEGYPQGCIDKVFVFLGFTCSSKAWQMLRAPRVHCRDVVVCARRAASSAYYYLRCVLCVCLYPSDVEQATIKYVFNMYPIIYGVSFLSLIGLMVYLCGP